MDRRVDLLIRFEVFVEGLTGLALIVAPVSICDALFGTRLDAVGAAVGRVAGIALLSMVSLCWGVRRDRGGRSALVGLLVYNALTGVYLGVVRIQAELVGPLLSPAVAAHLVLCGLLTVILSRRART